LLDFVEKGEKFIIAGHKEPDGDCLGSQLALSSFLARRGKQCVLVDEGPWKRSEIQRWKDKFRETISEADKTGARLIVVDCSGIDRTGDSLSPLLQDMPYALIDHHATNQTDCPVNYVDPRSPSTCVLIQKLIEAMGDTPTRDEAEFLFFGLCTDTGFFRHLEAGSGAVFAAAAKLVNAGASPKTAYNIINGGKRLISRRFTGLLLSRCESFFDDRLVYIPQTLEDTQEWGENNRDSDLIYQLLLTTEGVEAIVTVRQEKEDQCAVGFRSRETVDVAKIAASLGGGGHKNAAGLYIKSTIAELKPVILSKFAEAFGDA
jgi:phosphoesterase RecJ-like protein